MMKRIGSVMLLVAVGTFGVLLAVFHSNVGVVFASLFHSHVRVLQAEETDGEEPPAVSEANVQMYIKVYSAMQDDHDLTIDNAIKPYNITLDDFRQIERRIQGESRLVERVRQALLEHAEQRAAFAQAVATPTRAARAATPVGKKRKTKKK